MTTPSIRAAHIGAALLLSVLATSPALALDPTSTSLTSSLNPSKSGDSVTFTATVAGNRASTGSVTFNDGVTELGSATVEIRGARPAMSANVSYACAVTAGGGLKCWGNNSDGKLGDASGSNQDSPVDVSGLTSGVIGVTTGDDHTCALMATGGVKCWGRNAFGALGDGTKPTDHVTPVDVSGLSNAVAISAGFLHTCALTNTGGVKCWGSNDHGELGNNTQTEADTPVDVTGLTSGVVAIAAGSYSTCAITSGGTLKCWGDNGFGQLGTGDTTHRLTPVNILTGVAAVSIGNDHTCALMSGGGVKCWGFNDNKQVGDTTTTWRLTPADVVGLSGTTKAVSAGSSHTCALNDSGVIQCWGNNSYAQISNSTNTSFDVTTSSLTSGAIAVIAGDYFNCAQYPDSSLQCVGGNGSGQLGRGNGETLAEASPAGVVGFGAGAGLVFSKATLTTSALAVDDHSITAAYGGDSNNGASTSATLTQKVNESGKSNQTVNFTSSAPGSATVGGTPYAPAATASSGLTVSFGASGACTLSGGVVHFHTVGSCTVTADQTGDDDYNAATQATQMFSVAKGASTVAVSSSRNPSSPGQSVTFSALVSATADTSATATGTVTFRDGASPLGTVALSGGIADTSTSSLAIGTHTITAQYNGDANFQAAMSGNLGQQVTAKVGAQTAVNAHTAGSQQSPAVARLADNGYVIAWQSDGEDGSGDGIYAQRYRANGNKFGAALHVSTTTAGDQSAPAVAGLSDGRFVAIWQSPDTSGSGIYGQIYKATGDKSGAQFRVNARIPGAQTQPRIAALPGGKFVIVWTSNGQDGSSLGVYARLYDNAGKPASGELLTNTTTQGRQFNPAVAGLTNGTFVVTWEAADPSGDGIFMRRFNANGHAVGNETQVNTVTVNDQSLPAIAALSNGGFVIAWQSAQQDGSGLGVYAQCYRPTAAKQGGEIHLSTATAGNQAAPSIAAFTDGGFVAAWTSSGQDGSGQGVYAQAFSNAGARVNVEFGIPSMTAGNQTQPVEAAFASGNFVVVWTSADAAQNGIYSQRERVPGTN